MLSPKTIRESHGKEHLDTNTNINGRTDQRSKNIHILIVCNPSLLKYLYLFRIDGLIIFSRTEGHHTYFCSTFPKACKRAFMFPLFDRILRHLPNGAWRDHQTYSKGVRVVLCAHPSLLKCLFLWYRWFLFSRTRKTLLLSLLSEGTQPRFDFTFFDDIMLSNASPAAT